MGLTSFILTGMHAGTIGRSSQQPCKEQSLENQSPENSQSILRRKKIIQWVLQTYLFRAIGSPREKGQSSFNEKQKMTFVLSRNWVIRRFLHQVAVSTARRFSNDLEGPLTLKGEPLLESKGIKP